MALELESPILESKEKVMQVKNETVSMLTFAKKNEDTLNSNSLENKILNFNRPGLKKSGSFKMMEKMKETFPICDTYERNITPWDMEENV